METMDQFYPPVAFSFKLNVEGMTEGDEGNFQEVSGLNVKIAPKNVEEGGENRFAKRFTTLPKHGNLILKRGMLIGSPLINWVRDSIESFNLSPKIVNLYLLDQTGTPISTWKFINAYPIAMIISDFNAQEDTLIIETMELSFDSFTN